MSVFYTLLYCFIFICVWHMTGASHVNMTQKVKNGGNSMISFNSELSAGDKNKITVYLPDNHTKNRPVIIYCHGWGGRRKLQKPTQKLCDRAMELNIVLVTFDFFGCGETGGDYSEMTYTRWKNNLSDVVNWCREQPFASAEQIGCYAFSSGTTAALRLASEDSRIAFIASVGTCVSSHIGMASGGPPRILADNCKELLSGEKMNIFTIDFGFDFYVDTIRNAPLYTLDSVKCPVLFLQGLNDNPYRCADARLAADIMKREGLNAAIIEYEKGTHGLDNVVDEVLDDFFNWLPEPIVLS